MKSMRPLRLLLPSVSSTPFYFFTHSAAFLLSFYSAQPHRDDHLPSQPTTEEECPSSMDHSVFDSSHFHPINLFSDHTIQKPSWEEKYRDRVKSKVFGEEDASRLRILKREEEKKTKAARALLEVALDEDEDEDVDVDVVEVEEENQKSLSVGIVGAPNAGKSALTNFMVGTKVSAVSRKINTTTHEVLGVLTKGVTQICFFDTPGLMLKKSGIPYNDIKVRNDSAWSSVNLYDVLMIIFDVHRHLIRPDSRVVRLIERMGSIPNTNQKRVLCMNKVDLVTKKNDLLKVVEEFKDLPGYDKHFMISGLKGAGVKELIRYLMDKALKRRWDEDPFVMSEEVMKNISLEVVREKLLDYVHQEIPYGIEHRLVSWKELRDGSLRIEQHFITHKISQRKILVGKKGSKIGRIGMEANEELRSIFKRDVHLILMVRVK
ncbi:GTP-binding protein ERG [Andrographis paniculata]|uniref:GTP-binding protein ERG n=1 Tax=Andrographis paniculata TaxID=175694 RepID=UPI0021E7590D|nr:GTP-binding protein ERG [Andrographis paniculata]